MPDWVIWAIAAVALGIGEIFTPGLFFLGPVALAAVAAGFTALLGLGLVVQLIVFILGAIAAVAVLRPIARSHLRMPASTRTGTAALVGRLVAARPEPLHQDRCERDCEQDDQDNGEPVDHWTGKVRAR
jgi:membrane protein implicated in regulation of membrane protease activity